MEHRIIPLIRYIFSFENSCTEKSLIDMYVIKIFIFLHDFLYSAIEERNQENDRHQKRSVRRMQYDLSPHES